MQKEPAYKPHIFVPSEMQRGKTIQMSWTCPACIIMHLPVHHPDDGVAEYRWYDGIGSVINLHFCEQIRSSFIYEWW